MASEILKERRSTSGSSENQPTDTDTLKSTYRRASVFAVLVRKVDTNIGLCNKRSTR